MRERRFSGWVVALAVIAGSLLAPVGVMAAGSLIEISSPSGRVAQVGRAQQLFTAPTSPEWLRRGRAIVGQDVGCRPVIVAPSNRALIVTDVHIDTYSLSAPSQNRWVQLTTRSNCTQVVEYHNPTAIGTQTLSFGPGLAIPAGAGLYAQAASEVGAEVYGFGYLVPAGAVPTGSAEPAARTDAHAGPGSP